MICIVLKGHIFDSDDSRHANQSNKMLREIEEYTRRTYRYRWGIKPALELLAIPVTKIKDDLME